MAGNQFIILDKGGQVWTCSYDQNSVRVFHPNGTEAPFSPITQGKNSSGAATNIYQPSGIAMDTAGIIYVTCDYGANHNVFKYQSWDGIALNGFECSYRIGDIAFDSSNRLFMVEKVAADTVAFHVMDTTGTNFPGSPIIQTILTATVSRAIGVLPDSSKVFIASETLGRVLCFNGGIFGGTASYTLGADLASGLNVPGACEVDDNGLIYVSVTNDNAVRIYQPNGTLNETLTDSSLAKPRGVGFAPNTQVLYVAQFNANTSLQRWVIEPSLIVPVLGYHNVTASWNADHGMLISPDNLSDQLDFLQAHGYNVINMDDYYSWWMNGTSLPANPIVMTFDDNYYGELHFGGSLLTTRNMPGVIFAHTNYVGTSNSTGPKSTWSELSASEAQGLVRVESHTMNHVNLTGQSEPNNFSELTGSRNAIMANIPGKVCKYIAYPYGGDVYSSASYSPRGSIPTMTAQAGYSMAFSYAGGFSCRTTPLYNIPRVTMRGDDTLNGFKTRIGYSGSRILSDPYIVNNDDGDDGTISTVGTWSTATYLSNAHIGCYGLNFLVSASGTGSNSVSFTPALVQKGNYKVYAWWNADTGRSTNAPFTVQYKDGSTTLRVNQQTNGFCWNYLGTYAFDSGSVGKVILTNDADGTVDADAIKLVYESAVVPVELSSFEQEL
jgi:peptidoglycan/xylan/chitin deacetylase (PgdA/CDA1 family)